MDFTTVLTTGGNGICLQTYFDKGDISFDRIEIGSGINTNPKESTALANKQIVGRFLGIERNDENESAILKFTFDNKEVTEKFEFLEYGIWATYTTASGEKIDCLYAYGYLNSEKGMEIAAFTDAKSYFKDKLNVSLKVGSPDNVTVYLGEYEDYVSKKSFEDHINNQNNPHKVKLEELIESANLSEILKKIITDGKQHIKLANGRYLRGISTDGKEHTLIGLGTDNHIYIGNEESEYTHLHAKDNLCFKTSYSPIDGRYWGINSAGVFYPYKILNGGSAQANTASSLGTSSRRVGTIYASNALNTSDKKLKENIIDAEIGLEILKRLSIVQFNFIGEKEVKCGVIAQEVFKLFQELGIKNSGVYQASLIYDEYEETTGKDGNVIRIPKTIPEYENLSDDEILKHNDEELTWNINYDSLTYYCIAGFQAYMNRTDTELSEIKKILKEALNNE